MDANQARETLPSARTSSIAPESPELDTRTRKRSRANDENVPPPPSDWVGGAAAAQSLLSARRPPQSHFQVEPYRRARKPRVEREESVEVLAPIAAGLPESPEDAKGFHSSWQIDVKDLVGDAVGNMSISPTSRDIVLAARRGLFIIDLESPFSIPRFLPQGGTWDVADVQWNPHPSHAQYIVSTSSEKLLIWNLRMSGKTSIEHILRSHYRAITDINWHTSECDIVVSTGIDSWIWAWDLRTTQRPIFGLSAFKASGTQVKWNHRDPDLLASSHSNEVLIWDRRKGSLPISKIQAHASKIYGIDWSRQNRNEIVTCSLDQTIKTWDINDTNTEGPTKPISCIQTHYPVWRARNLPFAEGILSLPQRGETTLEMYDNSDPPERIETFEGHSDVVKEFVWRKAKQDDFQLITWSKDRTLRFWPINSEVMDKLGYSPDLVRGRSKQPKPGAEEDSSVNVGTFAHVPEVQEYLPFVSAPIGSRSILAEVRAPQPPSRFMAQHAHSGIHLGRPSTTESKSQDEATPTLTSSQPIAVATLKAAGGTMSKGGVGPKSVAQVDQLQWMASVRVGSKRGSSSGGGSHSGSGAASRIGSRSRTSSRHDLMEMGEEERSSSQNRATEDKKEAETNHWQSLQDEMTTVLTKLNLKLEKYDEMGKKRSFTLGLQGPWGASSSVFLRVTFTFPRDYPHGIHPQGTPTVEIEKNPSIPLQRRAYMLKRLRKIRERKRPCLEACLRFLLYMDEGNNPRALDSDSSDDEDGGGGKSVGVAAATLLGAPKNLGEPKTSQGSFGPNGEFVVFFRATPRINIRVLKNAGRSPNDPSNNTPNPEAGSSDVPPSHEPSPQPNQLLTQQQQQQQKSYFQSPALVSDAVRRLGLAATDRIVEPIDPRRPETGSHILRAMTHLLTMPQKNLRQPPNSNPTQSQSQNPAQDANNDKNNFSFMPMRRSTVSMANTTAIAGPDRKVALGYIFEAGSLAEVCERNGETARRFGRFDHERVFGTLRMLFRYPRRRSSALGGAGVEREEERSGGVGVGEEGVGLEEEEDGKELATSFSSDLLALKVISSLYKEVAQQKDIQMLAMIAVIVLQTPHAIIIPQPTLPPPGTSSSANRRKDILTNALLNIPNIPQLRTGGMDYFSLTKAINNPSPTSSTTTTTQHGQPHWNFPTPGSNVKLTLPHALPPTSPGGTGIITAVPLGQSLSSSNSNAGSSSSRGSWSSLFNTGSVRQFMSGMQESFRSEGGPLTTPTMELGSTTPDVAGFPGFPGPGGDVTTRSVGSGTGMGSRTRRLKKESSIHSVASGVSGITSIHGGGTGGAMSRSWNEGMPRAGAGAGGGGGGSPGLGPAGLGGGHSRAMATSFSSIGSGSGGGGRMRGVVRPVPPHPTEKQVIFKPPSYEEGTRPLFTAGFLEQLRLHVQVYAEILFRQQLNQKRLELLKAVARPSKNGLNKAGSTIAAQKGIGGGEGEAHRIGMSPSSLSLEGVLYGFVQETTVEFRYKIKGGNVGIVGCQRQCRLVLSVGFPCGVFRGHV